MKHSEKRKERIRRPARSISSTVLLLALVGSIAGVPSPAAAHPISFPTSVIDTNAAGAQEVATGDIDGDGDIDTASASATDNTVAWYENTAGDGSAWTPMNVDTNATSANSVVIADIDGDGDLDLASSSAADDTIAWYENTAGDGSAWTPMNIDTNADGANSVTAADLDGDGDVDLASAGFVDDTIAWYENDAGDGSAWTPTNISTVKDGASSIRAGDVDGDGDVDLASASLFAGDIDWYENTAGNASAWTADDVDLNVLGANSVAMGDLDGDGSLDLVSTGSGNDTIAWYRNTNGDGTAWAEANVSTAVDGPRSVTVADLDVDGDSDLVSTGSTDNSVTWHENTAGNATAWTGVDITTTASQAASATTGDLDGDGDLDVASASQGDNTIRKHQNAIPARSTPSWDRNDIDPLNDGSGSVTPVDIDGDGDLDLASAQTGGEMISVHENTGGDGSTWTETDYPAGNNPDALVAGDLDGDGDMDLAAAAVSGDEVIWLENTNGDGSAWAMTQVSTAGYPRDLTMGDFDGDGDLDLASANYSAHTVVWYKNVNGDGSAWTSTTVETGFTNTSGIANGDFDGDGDFDIVATSLSQAKIRLYKNNGTGSSWTGSNLSTTTPPGPVALEVADLDGDGDLDLASSSIDAAITPTETDVAWYENLNGDGSSWTTTNLDSVGIYSYAIDSGDLDGDGDLDLIAGSTQTDTLKAYINTAGDGSNWDSLAVSTTADGVNSVATADIDGDGDLDLAATLGGGFDTTWFEALPTLRAQNASVDEGETIPITVTVGRIHQQVSFDFTAYPGTASGVEDFLNLTDYPVTILPGSTSTQVDVTGVEDDVDEPDEYFYALLSDPSGAGIAPNTGLNQDPALGNILDDDPTPELTIDNVTVTEKDTSSVDADFTLELSNPSSEEVSVDVTTVQDSATKGDDYTHRDTSVNIPPGTTSKTFTVSVAGDKIDENKEKFFVDLSFPSGAILTADARGTGTIEDDDPKSKVSVKDVSKKEGDSGTKKFKFTVKLNLESSKTVEVDWKTVKKSAKSPSDYIKNDGTVKFKPGVTKKEVTVKVKGDKKNERKETFQVKLSKPVSSALGDKIGKGTIKNDD